MMQVSPSHYAFESYLGADRWASYYCQLRTVHQEGARKVLYVGVGDDIVPRALEAHGIDVSRFDMDPALGPDYVGDIRTLAEAVGDHTHDTIVCCQVLEHLPYEEFESLVRGLVKAASRRVIISLPYKHLQLFDAKVELPWAGAISIAAWTPHFWQNWKFDGQHYWEVGTRGHSKRTVVEAIKKQARVVRTFHAAGNRYHFFIVIDSSKSTA